MKVTRKEILKLFVDNGVDQKLVSKIKPDVSLTEQGLDSVDYPAVVVAINEKWGIAITDKEAAKIRTLQDFEKRLNR
jgi:acyl carrier protein